MSLPSLDVRIAARVETTNSRQRLMVISEHDQGKLFQPFARSSDRASRNRIGSGLGLNFSRKLARALGGDAVLLSSTAGVGGIFRFTFALSDEEEARTRLESAPEISRQ